MLRVFARHYQTGEVIPQEYIDALMRSVNFMEGYATVRQLSFGILDMAWHGKAADAYISDKKHDLIKFERNAIKATQLYPVVDGTALSTSFGHLFSGGYAAGYYSYKWSEMHDADAFEYFKEKGYYRARPENISRKKYCPRAAALLRMSFTAISADAMPIPMRC